MPPSSSPYLLSIPNNSRLSSASNVPGTDVAYDDLLEPIHSPPLSSMLGGIEFGREPLFESNYFLAAAALNPGVLKHGEVVDINHVSISPSPMPMRAYCKRQRDNKVFD